MEHFDVIIVGAGLSGIGAAHYLQRLASDRTFLILEGRQALGGTWDLFRYPGVRSDSDMFTLGYSFRPWTGEKSIAGGASILSYLNDTADEAGLRAHIRFGQRVTAASWSGADACWTVSVETSDGAGQLSCNFLQLCPGYYRYDRAYTPDFPGAEEFAGTIVHPQFWPENLDHAGKRVVVIGSGATAMTLVPSLAERAAHVTMLQRSPSYVVSLPAVDKFAGWLRRKLPAKAAYRVIRARNIVQAQLFYGLSRKRPKKTADQLIKLVADELGPDYDVGTHFTPRYDPWDERVCFVPDADLFTALKDGRAEMVTDRIDRFISTGIRLESGKELPADIVVTATGLEIEVLGGIHVELDGRVVNFADTYAYKGLMFSGVPNLSYTFGYTNASWTLKADLSAGYVCRLLNAMRNRGMRQITPMPSGDVGAEPFISFTSGYIRRSVDRLPRQGNRKPWRLNQNYTLDLLALRYGSIDSDMVFSNPAPALPRHAA